MKENNRQPAIGWHTDIPVPASETTLERLVPGQLVEQVEVITDESEPVPLRLSRIFQWEAGVFRCALDRQMEMPPTYQTVFWIYEIAAETFPEVQTDQQALGWAQNLLAQLSPFQPLCKDAEAQLTAPGFAARLPLPLFLEYPAGTQTHSLYVSRHTHPSGQEVLGLTLSHAR